MKLTDDQKRLVEENHNLIYSCMRDFGVRPNEYDDYYGDAAIALCKAVQKYNPSNELKCKLSTFCYHCIRSELKASLRNNLTKKNQLYNEALRLDNHVNNTQTYVDIICKNDNFEAISEVYVSILNLFHTIKDDRNKEFLKLFLNGYRVGEIAKMFKVSHTIVSRAVNSFRTKLKEEIS